MSRTVLISALCAILTITVSCGRRNSTHAPKAPSAPVPQKVSAFEELEVRGEPFMLSNGTLTGETAMEKAFTPRFDEYFSEDTPSRETFFRLEPDIRPDALATLVKLHWNYVCVYNRVIHAHEIFCRLSTDIGEEDRPTRRDTLEWVRLSRRIAPVTVPGGALGGAGAQAKEAARKLLAAWASFDGNDRDGSPLQTAAAQYSASYASLPSIVTDQEQNDFEAGFWEWYDKRQYVPEIDELVEPHLKDPMLPEPDSVGVARLKSAAEGERDIDRRTILALELAQWDRPEGARLLGDILESGLWTRYLLEAWISWRANVQMDVSPSSFSTVANNYYDRMRVKCLNTMLRHCQANPEDYGARCLIVNLILCEIIHRQGSIAGNTSFITCLDLSKWMFVHPRMRMLPEESM